MPYDSIADLPDAVQAKYSERCQEVFRKAFNRAIDDDQTEESAFKVAHTAAGMCQGTKAQVALKAEDMSKGELDKWLSGERSRRVLMVPFGGPLRGGKAGLDFDGEYFDDRTDLFGPRELFPMLHASRERIVDWHHNELGLPPDAPRRMKGAILGHVVMDAEPEDDGLWADWWANAGEKRLALVKMLEKRNVPLFGSTEAVSWAVRGGNKASGWTQPSPDGHIEVWPVVRHTISTTPQNTLAVVPPLKALLTTSAIDGLTLAALQAGIAGLLDAPELIQTVALSAHPAAAEAMKAGRVLSAENEAALKEAVEHLSRVLAKLQKPDRPQTQENDKDNA